MAITRCAPNSKTPIRKAFYMLTDSKIQALRRNPNTDTPKRIADRDGLYIKLTPKGCVSFLWDYWVGGRDGRRGTINFGQYPNVTLAEAREKLIEAKKDLAAGIDPARKKSDERRHLKSIGTLDAWWADYLAHSQIAESTKAMRCSIYKRDLQNMLGRRKLNDISESDIRALCDKIVGRGAPAVAVHVRDILLQVFHWAKLRGEKISNPAAEIAPTSIARFKPRERNLSPQEIKRAIEAFDDVGANVAIKAGAKLLLLTFVRKSELSNATWDEIDFDRALWTIPASRMKKRTPHIVPLSEQAIDILVALKTLAGASNYVLPGRYDSTKPISNATFNRLFQQVAEASRKRGKPLDDFGPHDLRRTASTLLHEAGFSSDWIEKQLAHEQRGVRAVYNKAQYLEQRRQMMQTWADMVDAYCK